MRTDKDEPVAEGYLALSMPELEAALADQPPQQTPQLQPWPAGITVLRRTVESATQSLLTRLKKLLHNGEHPGEARH
jgi:hypothetical protein